MSFRKAAITGAGMILAVVALTGCKPSNSGLEKLTKPNVTRQDSPEVVFDPNHGRLGYTDVSYIKDIRLASAAVGSDDYVRCTMEVSYKKDGKKVDESSNFVQVNPNSMYDGLLMAHILPTEIVLGNKPCFFDEVTLSFKSDNSGYKLPDSVILPITGQHLAEYKTDFHSYAACREANLRESAKKSGISSGRY